MLLPAAFTHRMERLLQNEYQDFTGTLAQGAAATAIRLNPAKKPHPVFEDTTPVPWCQNALLLARRPQFTLHPPLHAGVYYVQEASSMFIDQIIKQLQLDRQPLLATDLCAAPGGKTTLLASGLHPDSLVIANEVIKTRTPVLTENVTKWGLPNIWVTANDTADFTPLGAIFDLVLTDAPCSGEGLFRKTPDAVQEWSEGNVQLCSARQRRILANAVRLVKPGGYLIYSTCTYAEEENEQNAAWIAAEYGFESVQLMLQPQWGITQTQTPLPNGKTVYGYRFYPHKTVGEGFFVACLQKQQSQAPSSGKQDFGKKLGKQPFEKLPKKLIPMVQNRLQNPDAYTFYQKKQAEIFAVPNNYAHLLPHIATGLVVKQAGILMGEVKGNELAPAPALALSIEISGNVPRVELDLPDALAFLRKQNFTAPLPDNLRGWTLVTYQLHPLGWIKALPNRYNNYHPTEWRIKNLL